MRYNKNHTLTLQKLVIEEIWNRKHKRAISTKCPYIFYVNVTPAIEIQKLPYVRKLTKLIAASSRAIRTFSLDYHKNFFWCANGYVAREKGTNVFYVFAETSNNFHFSRERLAVWCTKKSFRCAGIELGTWILFSTQRSIPKF